MALLSVKNLSIRFGGLCAIDNFSFEVQDGQIYAIIGPNGAGKTTVFNVISGIYNPSAGEILLNNSTPHKSWCVKDSILIFLVALSSLIASILALNILSFWQNSISNNYLFNQSFDWFKAYQDFISSFKELNFYQLQLTGFIGLVLGAASYIVLWRRSRRTADYLANLGIRRTFQNIRLFPDLSVKENVLLGLSSSYSINIFDIILRSSRFKRIKKDNEMRAYQALEFVGLEKLLEQEVASLAYGHQRLVEIARAIIAKPKLLLLDEPAAGMNPAESKELVELIKKISASGISILLIEHDMKLVMNISDKISVLNYGKEIASGTAAEVRNNPAVIDAYLGKGVRG